MAFPGVLLTTIYHRYPTPREVKMCILCYLGPEETTELGKPGGEAMNIVYDMLRRLSADELREFRNLAMWKYNETGLSDHALIVYQCHETARRWNAGIWEYNPTLRIRQGPEE